MAGRKFQSGSVTVDLGELLPPQQRFCRATQKFVAYGGARGGGKTHILRVKALGGALCNPGLRVLIVRREYPELEQTIILPMKRMVPPQLGIYNGAMRMIQLANDSVIKFGHYGAKDDLEYQGQEWDWIFMDEATQFTEEQFRILGACLRGAEKRQRRIYLTCNPGGVGHAWVKRLFIDREYVAENGERGEDYVFIPAKVKDNTYLMEGSPEYLTMLDSQPEDRRRAWRDGDWNGLSGAFFPEFRKEVHVIPPMWKVPAEWRKFRVFDYGLDMFALLWVAVDFDGRCYVYREYCQSNLNVSDAAAAALGMTPPEEGITCTYAPPDMWGRSSESGKTRAELFAEAGLPLVRSSNDRIAGWMAVKEMLKPLKSPEDRPGVLVTEDCKTLIRNIQLIQHDEKKPDDCAKEPHDLTHVCDSFRYFLCMRVLHPEQVTVAAEYDDYGDGGVEDYDEAMTGGEAGEDYISYGG